MSASTPAGEPSPTFWPTILGRLTAQESLTKQEAGQAMRVIMQGMATQAQIAGFLMALRTKGETTEELEGLADTTLEFAQPVRAPGPVADTCGTGGDRAGTLNVSTLGAIVCAGAGLAVAKHGNRAASSRCGSADLLEALGVRIDLGPRGVERCLEEAGIGFMFAPVFHPAAAHAAGVRRELRVPTAFNFLGPLTNPARPVAQIVGVSDPRMLPLVAEVLARRGVRAMVFRGGDGLDELTTTGPSTVYRIDEGEFLEFELDPEEAGLPRADPEDLRGGDVERNVAIARAVLAGEPGPPRDVVLLNAAAALVVADRAGDLRLGVEVAEGSIDSGAAAGVLERWVEVSNGSASSEG
ncbi:MAG: anthranilate phosphoribosyltransferase [Actinomycetota bacterium]|nr:anthranilate phosphoribosyltransferase [Actinomycetota bacterium]